MRGRKDRGLTELFEDPERAEALLADLQKAKPSSAKGIYMKKVSVSTTMGPGLQVDQTSLGM